MSIEHPTMKMAAKDEVTTSLVVGVRRICFRLARGIYNHYF
jgi:hypothetical protein